MTRLSLLRQARVWTPAALAHEVRLPRASVEAMEAGIYPVDRISPETGAILQARLQRALGTDLSLGDMLRPIQ